LSEDEKALNVPLSALGLVAIAVVVMVASQFVRMAQTAPELWLAVDYAGRLLSLTVLMAPGTRAIAFRREQRRVSVLELCTWIAALVILQELVLNWLGSWVDAMFPGTALALIPALQGAPLLVDLTLGLALVALHEEIVFRRVTRSMLKPLFGDGVVMALASSIPFGLYHWQFGVDSMVSAGLFGACAMLMYLRVGSIVPVMVAHYLVNVLWTIKDFRDISIW
jgi:membrane protease YdiL (CAAX protease family)